MMIFDLGHPIESNFNHPLDCQWIQIRSLNFKTLTAGLQSIHPSSLETLFSSFDFYKFISFKPFSVFQVLETFD